MRTRYDKLTLLHMSDTAASTGSFDLPDFIEEAIDSFERLTKFRQFAVFAFGFGTTTHDLYSLLDDQSQNPSSALRQMKAKAENLQPYAQAEAAQGLAYLNGLLVVRLVTLLETMVNARSFGR
jgi:hypothetical protein